MNAVVAGERAAAERIAAVLSAEGIGCEVAAGGGLAEDFLALEGLVGPGTFVACVGSQDPALAAAVVAAKAGVPLAHVGDADERGEARIIGHLAQLETGDAAEIVRWVQGPASDLH